MRKLGSVKVPFWMVRRGWEGKVEVEVEVGWVRMVMLKLRSEARRCLSAAEPTLPPA